MTTDKDEERVAITAYVPEYQREQWKGHANELEMSLSEFVRTMVQAGRKGFEEPPSAGPNPGGNSLETLLQDTLADEGKQFEELVVQAESRLTDAVARLRDDGVISQDVDGTLRWEDA